jgi:intein/homing endonuclease
MSHKFMTPHGDMSCEILAREDTVHKIVNNEVIAITINHMEVIEEKEYVYSIEVENAHTYITENHILHHNLKE